MEKNDEKILLLKKICKFFIKDNLNYKLFFCTYAKNIGFFFFLFFSKKKLRFWNGFIILIKDILYSSYYADMKIHKPKKILTEYNAIIVTWAYKRNFISDGSFDDQVLNCNSKSQKKTLWFVIYMDSNLPKKFMNNIVILTPFLNKKLNILFFLKNLIKNFNKKFYSLAFNLQFFSSFSIFADNANQLFLEFINKNVTLIFMPYEAQPFQNIFFMSAKKISKKIKTVGYIHSPPEAFPVQSIYKYGAPENLIVNGKDQVYCYKKYLGWRKTKFLILPSIRFKKRYLLESFKNRIFLPFTISNPQNVMENLEFLYTNKIIDIKRFKIQGHPLTKNNLEIKKFINKIKSIKKLNNIFLKKNTNLSIFIGASGAAAEFLERGSLAIHISDNPTTDIYSSKLYPSLKVHKIKKNIYSYNLKTKGRLLSLGGKKDNLKKYLKYI